MAKVTIDSGFLDGQLGLNKSDTSNEVLAKRNAEIAEKVRLQARKKYNKEIEKLDEETNKKILERIEKATRKSLNDI